jgi:guanylate kinase
MKDKIICLVGQSGSGKTTIAKELEKAGYNVIQSYTTRPPREPNEWGHTFVNPHDYVFNDDKGQVFKKVGGGVALGLNMIAYTHFDNAYYWTLPDQYQGKGISIYVIDVAGVKIIREKVKDAEIVVIYIQADEETRKRRMIWRYNTTHNDSILADGKLDDLERRMDNDRKAFRIIPCDYAVDNNGSLEVAVEAVKKIIEGDSK